MPTSIASPVRRPATTAEASHSWERYRRWLVFLTFTIYWLAILEGTLRKWVFPEYGRYLYFVRDPFVLLVYFLAIKAHFWPRRTALLTFGLLFAAAALILIVIQARLADIPFSWLLAAIGWRMYFFYLPLPFLIWRFFERRDFDRLVRHTLLFAIPVAVLVYLQAHSSAASPLNAGYLANSEDKMWVMTNGRSVRTTGTFTSPVGQGYFGFSLVAMLVATWLVRPSRRPIRGWALWLATAAAATCLLLSGNRAAFAGTGLILSTVGVGLLFVGRQKLLLRLVVGLIVLTPLGIWTANLAFPESVANIVEHFQGARESELGSFGQFGMVSRALFSIYSFAYLIPQTPAMGFGMGLATNAATSLTSDIRKMHGASQFIAVWLPTNELRFAYETGLGRQIIDLGPIFGVLYIAFRWALLLWIGAKALKATRRSGDITPIAAFSFVVFPMALDALTANTAVHVYGWLFAGFALAAARFTAGSTKTLTVAPVLPVTRRSRLAPVSQVPSGVR